MIDSDTDTVPNGCDNCALVANPDKGDSNFDGTGDACCCTDRVGDVNGNGGDEPTIGDVSAIVDFLIILSTIA